MAQIMKLVGATETAAPSTKTEYVRVPTALFNKMAVALGSGDDAKCSAAYKALVKALPNKLPKAAQPKGAPMSKEAEALKKNDSKRIKGKLEGSSAVKSIQPSQIAALIIASESIAMGEMEIDHASALAMDMAEDLLKTVDPLPKKIVNGFLNAMRNPTYGATYEPLLAAFKMATPEAKKILPNAELDDAHTIPQLRSLTKHLPDSGKAIAAKIVKALVQFDKSQR